MREKMTSVGGLQDQGSKTGPAPPVRPLRDRSKRRAYASNFGKNGWGVTVIIEPQ